MAFPGTYNISYYKGDTLEFRVYPKDASGAVFDLTGYDLDTGAQFTISTDRGTDGVSSQISAYAKISSDRTYILCAIRPTDSYSMNPRDQYVYDVQISKTSTPYNSVHTLLTGTLTITDQVTGAA